MEVSIPKLTKMVSLIIVAYVFFSGPRQAVAASAGDPSQSGFEACKPRNCGSGPNISFPFYVENVGADFCGLMGLGIRCWAGKPIYNTTRGPYVVTDISYSNHYLRLVDLDTFSSCLAPRHYFIFDNDRGLTKRFRPDHANLQFFYNCTNLGSARILRIGRDVSLVGCASNSSVSSFVALVVDNDDLSSTTSDSKRFCESQVAVPVNLGGNWSQNASIKSVDYEGLLRRGFVLDWEGSESVRCSPCSRSGGRCGVQRGFACFCPDGTSRPANCTTTISPAGVNRTADSDVQITPTQGKSASLVVTLGILAAITVMLGLTVILFFCLRKKSSSINRSIFFWKNQNQTYEHVEAFLKTYGPIQVRRYSYREIKKMTRNFEEDLGKGGFGDVYKGKLEDGCLVAVKVSNNSKFDDNGQDFINEVAAISRTSHVNVVSLLGFCFEGAKRALIYEFMPNGSLEKVIFNENIQIFDCHRIALGIAKGLEYLHRGCNTRIVHFDIKPHNILLDADLEPKISDFGLAKICTRNESAVSMFAPRGTIGYIAPEITSRSFGEVSHKSDVYSYGMMILEMVGGRKNVNVSAANTSEIYFPYWVYKRIELEEDLGLKRIINGKYDELKARKMVIVSLWCIQTDPSHRPTMSKVIEMLESDLECLPIPPKPFSSSPSSSSPLESN